MNSQTRKIQREVVLEVSCERAFKLLITPSEIQNWWSANRAIVLPRIGGTWSATWGENEDDPDYITCARIIKFDPPTILCLSDYQYFTKEGGLPFEADFTTEFKIEPRDGKTILMVSQEGFPVDSSADDFYQGCQKGWDDTFESIKKYLKNAQD